MSAQFTRPLPAPSTVTTVHTSAPIPTPEEAGTTTTYKRAALWVSLVVLLLAVAGIGGTWWWTEYGPGSYLTMPATDGRPLADVETDLGAMGLAFSVEEEFSDDVATGSVTRSDPEGGTPVHKRADVQLYVSKGVDMKTVPDVGGKTQDDAKKALSDAGLALGAITDAYSEEVPQGQVISQSAPSGTSVPHDTAIDVVLSKGREPLTVPSLNGMSADAAKKAIEGLGLAAAPTEAFSDTVAQGQVISQQTAEGSILHRGDTVAYTVSKGPEKVAVPDVVGRQRDDARSVLEAAGFTVQEEAILGRHDHHRLTRRRVRRPRIQRKIPGLVQFDEAGDLLVRGITPRVRNPAPGTEQPGRPSPGSADGSDAGLRASRNGPARPRHRYAHCRRSPR